MNPNLKTFLLLMHCTLLISYADAPPSLEQAEQFSKLILGELSNNEVSSLLATCKKNPNDNPFCSSALQWRKIQRFATPPNENPTILQKPKPVSLKFKGNTLLNWDRSRKQEVKRLVKALDGESRERLNGIKSRALKETRCPNRLAPAIAATLEDELPSGVSKKDLAKLYEKGGHCTGRHDKDREHFLTRSGILYFQIGDYHSASRVLSKVRPIDFFDGRSLYWRWRVETSIGNKKSAEKHLDQLIDQHPFSFHASVAALQSGHDYKKEFLASEKKSFSSILNSHPEAQKIVFQAESLSQFHFYRASDILIDWATHSLRRLNSELKLALVERGSPSLKASITPLILMAKPMLISRASLELAYPLDYFALFKDSASGVDPYALMALAKKESHFNPFVVSGAGAKGLLQILPKTAEKLRPGKTVDLFDIKTNIQIGAEYFKFLLDQTKKQTYLALASYNAGPEVVNDWLKRYQTSDLVLFIDLIPYRETRDYVGYVLSNYIWYTRLYNPSETSHLKEMLTTNHKQIETPLAEKH